MQNRGNAKGTADFCESRSCLFYGFGDKEPCFACGSGNTTGNNDQNIFFDQFTGKVYVTVVMFILGIITADRKSVV